jgi:hypothetical protein
VKDHLLPALSAIGVQRGTATTKGATATLLEKNINKEPYSDDLVETIELGCIARWHMKPLRGDILSGYTNYFVQIYSLSISQIHPDITFILLHVATKEGLANEENVLQLLPAFIKAQSTEAEKQSNCPVPFYIKEIMTMGLVESKKYTRLGTSVDALVMLNTDANAGSEDISIVEIKTKTTVRTQQEQENKISSGELSTFKYIEISFDDAESVHEFKKYVDVSDHRCQVLHHVATFGLRFGIYVVAKWKKILRVVICQFDDEVVTCYSELLQSIQKKYLEIFDKPTTIPDHFAGLDLGHVRSLEDLKFSVSLTNGLREFVKQVCAQDKKTQH